jgi:type I restriction enzyme S subunit
LLEGLEINIVNFINLYSQEDDTFRFDSEHYQKNYRAIIDKIKRKEYKKLSELIKTPVITGHTPSMKIDRFYGGNVKFIKTDNLRENRISGEFSHTLTKEGNKEIARSTLKVGDIITTIIGATYDIVGRTSIIQKEILPANINQNIALIRPNNELINSDYLNIYLNTKYGRNLLYWQSRQTGQVNLNCREVERIYVPLFNTLETAIAKIVHEIEILKIDLKTKYEQAENLLLETLGLANFQPSQEPINVKGFTESFGSSGRLDAEYYQLKYEDYYSLITSYLGGHEYFSTACNLKDKNFKPEDKTEYKYIELANIGKSGEITDCTTELGEELPTRARRKVATNDVVVSSIEGSLDSCALVTPEYDNALCSTGFYVVNSKKLNPETLLVLFKSEPMQALLKKGCSGTILTAISKTELSKIPIPLIDMETQEAIKEKINESFEMRKQSEHLLEVAKTAVEMAIEQDEETAMKYIKKETE